MKNIWFFGDSFTDGTQCNSGDEYYESYPELVGEKWTTIVSREMEGIEQLKSLPACSIHYILKELILNLSKFKKDDIVILSGTIIERLDTYAIWHKNEKEISEDIRNKIISKPIMYELLEEKKYSGIISLKRRVNLLEYMEHNIFPYVQYIKKDFEEQIYSIKHELIKRGVDFFYWEHSDVYKFESIEKETNGKIKDGHFSWKGHKDFAKYFLTEYVKLPKYINLI